jgi:cbb3-type cytochrome oxidase maturation protein
MSVIILLIAVSLTLALGFLACFVWAVRSGQFEDTVTPSLRILTEEEKRKQNPDLTRK